jgi:hypothetical protein
MYTQQRYSTLLVSGDTIYIDIAWYGQEWAMNIGIPDIHPRVYVRIRIYIYLLLS